MSTAEVKEQTPVLSDSTELDEPNEKLYLFKNDFGLDQNVDLSPEVSHRLLQQVPLQLLVVEDDSINRAVLLKILQKLKYNADSAENGEQALTKVKEKKYDIVFMDIRMPGMNGLKTSKKIVEYFKEKHTDPPVIVALSSYWYEKYKDSYAKVGMTDFLAKPVKISEIQDMLLKYGAIMNKTN